MLISSAKATSQPLQVPKDTPCLPPHALFLAAPRQTTTRRSQTVRADACFFFFFLFLLFPLFSFPCSLFGSTDTKLYTRGNEAHGTLMHRFMHPHTPQQTHAACQYVVSDFATRVLTCYAAWFCCIFLFAFLLSVTILEPHWSLTMQPPSDFSSHRSASKLIQQQQSQFLQRQHKLVATKSPLARKMESQTTPRYNSPRPATAPSSGRATPADESPRDFFMPASTLELKTFSRAVREAIEKAKRKAQLKSPALKSYDANNKPRSPFHERLFVDAQRREESLSVRRQEEMTRLENDLVSMCSEFSRSSPVSARASRQHSRNQTPLSHSCVDNLFFSQGLPHILMLTL